MTERAASYCPHFLLLPYVQQGHINPMLSLAYELAASGCKVTFVKGEKHAKSASLLLAKLEEDDISGVEFVNLAEASNINKLLVSCCTASTGQELTSKLDVCKTALAGLEERMQALAAELVESSRASANPISCIISDFFMWKWVADLARTKGVQVAALWTSSALSLYVIFLKHKLKEEVVVSRLGQPSEEDAVACYGLMGVRETAEVRRQMVSFLGGLLEGIEEAGLHILVNSCRALEGGIVDASAPLLELACKGSTVMNLSISLVGPLRLSRDGLIDAGSEAAACCLAWLDEQRMKAAGRVRSVVYVSLIGSEEGMELGDGQADEIAAGIEDSGYQFLWVVRPEAPATSHPPAELRERLERSGRGLFVAWAPQVRLLQHPAVGAFVTHSGWNSTLESLCAGVPMLCLPLLGDQPLNAFLVESTQYLQAGIRPLPIPAPDPTQSGRFLPLVPREHVESAVRALMQPAGAFSQRASQLRQAVALDAAACSLVSAILH